jgi:serine/threonine protein kinase/tetratricopeptide (TPR) repeat protein
MEATIVHDLTGITVGRFTVRERLGAGGMGEVYRAYDPRLKKDVALKRLSPILQNNPDFRERFEREAQLGATLDHPHVAAIRDVIDDQSGFFLLMDYVDGATLREYMCSDIDVDEFLRIAIQCADGIAAAHAKKIIHRDIKPENIMLTSGRQVKICDFGVAKLDSGEMANEDTGTGTFVGTPAYAAPEVVSNKTADHRADLFSLGVVFYEMLTRHHPFRSENLKGTNARILLETPLPVRKFNPAVPRRLASIIERLLEKDPDDRFTSAAELLEDLRAIATRRRRPRRTIYLAVTAAAIIATAALWIQFHDTARVLTTPSSLPARKNLVVLPFTLIGGNPDNRIYSEGLVEILTSRLTQMTLSPGLQVIGAADARARHIDSAVKAREEFGANLVLAGGFQFFPDVVKVTYSLVDTSNSKVLRTESIDAPLADPFALQDRVVKATLRMLELQLGANAGNAAVPTRSNAAMDAYVQGVGYLNRILDNDENIDYAITAFQRATDNDPNFALAYSQLGQTYVEKFRTTRQAEAVDAARRDCDSSMRLNPNLSEAHICVGRVNTLSGEYEKAALEFERAIEIEPTADQAYRGLGAADEARGRMEDAELAFRRAIDTRPHYAETYVWLGDFYLGQNRHAEAIAQFRHALTLAPDDGVILLSLGLAYANIGQFDDAIATLQKGITVRPRYVMFNNLGLTYMRARRLAEAIPELEVAVRMAQDYRTSGNLARAYYWTAGMREKAPAMYERAIKEGEEELRINPRNADAHILLARYYSMINRRAQALNHLEYALTVRPANSHYLVIAAGAQNQLGDRSAALSMLGRAVSSGLTRKEMDMEYEVQSLYTDPRFSALQLK